MSDHNRSSDHGPLAERVADLAGGRGLRVAVAESLTGGLVSSALAAAPDASSWYRGCLVAYARDVKHELLRVPDGPVVSAPAARAMAVGARRLLGAEVGLAITGSGGPQPQDGQPPGTVFIGLADGTTDIVVDRFFADRPPAQVCQLAATEALRLLAHLLE